MLAVEISDDEEEGRRGQQTLQNLKNYNLKLIVYNWASGCKEVKQTTLVSAWTNILHAIVEQHNLEGFEHKGYHRILQLAGKNTVLEDVQIWLDAGDDPCYQNMSEEETVDCFWSTIRF